MRVEKNYTLYILYITVLCFLSLVGTRPAEVLQNSHRHFHYLHDDSGGSLPCWRGLPQQHSCCRRGPVHTCVAVHTRPGGTQSLYFIPEKEQNQMLPLLKQHNSICHIEHTLILPTLLCGYPRLCLLIWRSLPRCSQVLFMMWITLGFPISFSSTPVSSHSSAVWTCVDTECFEKCQW